MSIIEKMSIKQIVYMTLQFVDLKSIPMLMLVLLLFMLKIAKLKLLVLAMIINLLIPKQVIIFKPMMKANQIFKMTVLGKLFILILNLRRLLLLELRKRFLVLDMILFLIILKMLLGLVIPAQIILLLFVKINLNFVLLNLSQFNMKVAIFLRVKLLKM